MQLLIGQDHRHPHGSMDDEILRAARSDSGGKGKEGDGERGSEEEGRRESAHVDGDCMCTIGWRCI